MPQMTAETLAAAILRDVKRYEPDWAKYSDYRSEMVFHPVGDWLSHDEVLAALSRAMSDDLAERAGEVVPRLKSKTPNMTAGHAAMEEAADLITALLTANAALRANAVQMLDEADREYNRKTNDLIERHAEQLAALRAERDQYLRHLTAGAESLRRFEARAERLEAAGNALEMAASRVSQIGAETGPQWSKLTVALLKYRAALKENSHE